MLRLVFYGVILALTVFVLVVTLMLREGEPTQSAMQVPLSDLTAAPQAHNGERVATVGVLRFVSQPSERFLLSDEDADIRVRGYSPDRLSPLLGQRVIVTGEFGFDEREGPYIEAQSVEPLP